MIMCCAWCFAPLNLTEEEVFSVIMDGVLPVCSQECADAHAEMIENERAGEDEK